MKPLAVTFIAVALLASPLVAAGRDRRPDQGESLMNAVDDLSKDAQAPGANSAWTGLAKHLQTVATAFGLSWPMGRPAH